MSFQQQAPDPQLDGLIAQYWKLDNLTPGQRFMAAPKRHVEFVVNFGAPQWVARFGQEEECAYRSSWLTGVRDQPLFIRPIGHSVQFGAVFRDFAVPSWLACDVDRELNWSTDLESSNQLRQLTEELAGCVTLADASACFNRFFLNETKLPRHLDQLPGAINSCETDGQLTPSEIISRSGVQPQRLRKMAKSIAGVSLRRHVRLMRFDRAQRLIATLSTGRLADIAQEAGYYDEAHMAHDFVGLCGHTAGAMKRARTNSEGLPHHVYRCW